MRLTFPNGEHDPVHFDQGELLIGSDPACAIALNAEGIRPMHAVLSIDPRGLALSVLGKGGEATHVNDRLVEELALVRSGDELQIAAVRILLKSTEAPRDQPPPSDAARVGVSGSYPRVILRGMSGDWKGRFARLRDTLRFGSDPDCDVDLPAERAAPMHSTLELSMEGIFLRANAPGNNVQVNGHDYENVVLKPNDQLLIGGERFVIEAPGYRPVTVTPVPSSNPAVTGVMRRIEALDPPPIDATIERKTASPAATPRGDFVSEMPDWLWFSLIGLIAVGSGVLVWYLRS
jgi:hypothetical protein